MFSLFTHHGKSDYHCEVCIPFQRWAKTNGVKHSALKLKQLAIEDIINDTATLNFCGVVQAHQNSDACVHLFTEWIADLLDTHVPGSQGTSLYICSVFHLLNLSGSPILVRCLMFNSLFFVA